MEALRLLEQKIIDFVEKLKKVQGENGRLVAENVRLEGELKMLESHVQKETASVDKLSHENDTAKEVVAGLIKHIDAIIENNQ